MAYFPTGAQARERAQNNNTLAQQIPSQEKVLAAHIFIGKLLGKPTSDLVYSTFHINIIN